GNRQLYRTADFAESFSAINAAKVFKDAMKTSRMLGLAGEAAFLLGVESNIKDMWESCDSNDLTEECARSMTRNGASMFANYNIGNGIVMISVYLVPYTMGISLAVGVGGTMLWGYYGGTLTDKFGEYFEYLTFDLPNEITKIVKEVL
ncbi:hypothetical protein ACF8PC_11205, partial [Photobacterium damselae]